MPHLARVFRALADANRLRIVNILSQESLCVCDLQSVLGLAQPFISRHLAYLRKAGLVEFEREGPRVCYSLVSNTRFDQALRSFLHEVFVLSADFQADLGRLRECRESGQLKSAVKDADQPGRKAA
jgi:ArsR family transcriptional regulator